MKKKLMSLFLAMTILMTALPYSAWADEGVAVQISSEDQSLTEDSKQESSPSPSADTDSSKKDGAGLSDPSSNLSSETPLQDAGAVDYEDLLYKHFSAFESLFNGLQIPYTGEDTIDLIKLLQAEVKKAIGKDATVKVKKFDPFVGSMYSDWSSGEKVDVDLRPEVIGNESTKHGYFKNNEPYKFFKVEGMQVDFDGQSINFEKIKDKKLSFFLSIGSKIRTAEEMVDFELTQYPDKRILAGNVSLDKVVSPVGEAGWSVSLPTKSEVYEKKVAVNWKSEHVEGNADAFSLTGDKTKILRPNVGENDAKVKLIAKISSKEDPSIKKEKSFNITIPAFDAQKIPIQITKDSKLVIKDPYYKNKEIDPKYIETDPNGTILTYTLHANEKDLAQRYYYEVSKDGYLSKKGSFAITKQSAPHPMLDLRLAESTNQDTDLKNIQIINPAPNTSALKKNIDAFEPNKMEYYAEVGGVDSVTFKIDRLLTDADVKVTRYSSITSANEDKTYTSSIGSDSTVVCYLPNELKESTIRIEVLPPAGSILTQNKIYTVKIKKTEKAHALSGVEINTISSAKGSRSNGLSDHGIPEEEAFSPSLTPGSIEKIYQYPVNYWMDKAEITPTPTDTDLLEKLEVEDQEIDLFFPNAVEKELQVGDNPIVIKATLKDGTIETYNINIRRKAELKIDSFSIKDGYVRKEADPKDWTGQVGFAPDAKEVEVTVHANDPAAEVILTNLSTSEISKGRSGKPIKTQVGDSSTVVYSVILKKDVGGTIEGVRYIIGFYRDASGSPNAFESYLPAPGQFVNQPIYGNPKATLSMSSGDMVTLGAYGGNIVWRFDQPILDDPSNPYGIDFMIFGNVFRNQDGSSAEGAAEPAAVMVSSDGDTWYELAGSQYYEASTVKKAKITYTNPDTAFIRSEPIPWKIEGVNYSKQDIFYPNSYHKQPYYPNPAEYSKFQDGVGKNDSYSASTLRFEGTLIDTDDSIVFGYADAHANAENKASLSQAVNPYLRNHTAVTNGDGFDLAWAVDSNGDPVKLDKGVRYVKVYNAVMNVSSSFGEKSPEITGILRAKKTDKPVGKSQELTELLVNGEKVTLQNGVYSYNVNIGDAKSIQITPTVADPSGTNIYVSNRWVASGSASRHMLPVEKTRVIVQSEDKEPIIYILNIQGSNLPSANADPKQIQILPDNVMAEKETNGNYKASIPYLTSSIKVSIPPLNKAAQVEVNGKKLTEDKNWHSDESFVIPAGGSVQIPVKITSADQSNINEFILIVTRGTAPSQPSPDTIQVSFQLIGPKGTPNNIWISNATYTILKDSTVKFITEKLLIENNIPYITNTEGTYISSINGLAEFHRGPNSGWMYRVNGIISNVGFAEKKLQHGDRVLWFYTDDYTKETGYEPWDPVPGGGGSGGSPSTDPKPNPTPTEILPDNVPLSDINGHWAGEAISYIVNKGLLGTIDGKSFGPDLHMTRAMFVTVLFRMDNEPEMEYKNIYKDVKDGLWYSKSVNWASQKGLVKGIGKNIFGINEKITREQLAVLMMRYAQYRGIDTSVRGDLSKFKDIGPKSIWAKDALSWAVGTNLLGGTSENKMEPKAYTTRAEIAVILMRFEILLETK